jgi:hypothetical protein
MQNGRVKYTANELQAILIKLYDEQVTLLLGSPEEIEIDHQIDFLEGKLASRMYRAKRQAN